MNRVAAGKTNYLKWAAYASLASGGWINSTLSKPPSSDRP